MIINLLEELYATNKYLIKIYNTANADWTIYMFKDQHIQVDIQKPNSLSSFHIKAPEIMDYIEREMENPASHIKIKYSYHYDDLPEYIIKIKDILQKIKTYYAENNKTVILKPKCRCM